MNKENLNFFTNQNIQIDLNSFILGLTCIALLCLIIKLFYIRFSSTLSNRVDFSKNFIILGITTFIIIMIIKNSLALSLGLVGALSIVRFRTAIKEPEELIYLFLVITAGLGCGAGQLKITIVGVSFALIVIYINYLFLSKSKIVYSELINLAIVVEADMKHDTINNLISELKKVSTELNFVSMSKTNKDTSINIEIRPKKFEEIIKLTDKLKQKFKKSKIIIARNNNLSL